MQPSVHAVIAPYEQATWLVPALPGWTCTRAILHSLPNTEHLPTDAAGAVRFLDVDRLDQFQLPADLREELTTNPDGSPIAATFVGQQPVAFCYAGSVTETLWDVSIDTLPEYRRQGHAAQCAAYMIRYMHRRGRQPVWAALENNPASWRLAQKLGFVAVDALALFEPHV